MSQEVKNKIIEYIQYHLGVYNEDEYCKYKYMESALDLLYQELVDELLT